MVFFCDPVHGAEVIQHGGQDWLSWVFSLKHACSLVLGKFGPIVHINIMSDKHDNPSGEQARATPQYRVRKPEGETSSPKSVQNTAEPPAVAPAEPGGADAQPDSADKAPDKAKEIGGPKGLEPTRFGDWERDGRCVDF